jgi:hypothetical protein
MQCSPSPEKKTKVTKSKTNPQYRLRLQKHAQREGVTHGAFHINVSLTRDQELANIHVTFHNRKMKCSISPNKKTRVTMSTTFKTNPQYRLRFQKRVQGAGVALCFFHVDVSLTRDQELANLQMTFHRRLMQCSPSPEKKTRVTTFKTNPQFRFRFQKHV